MECATNLIFGTQRKRGGISLYACTEIDFRGSCILVNFLTSDAIMLFTNTIFDKHVKSCGPEPGVTCNLFAYVLLQAPPNFHQLSLPPLPFFQISFFQSRNNGF